MILRNFIVFEGIDGAGTTTQLNAIKNDPRSEHFLFTQEPTDAETGKFLRRMLKGEVKAELSTAAYLFAADRNEHVNGQLVKDENRHLVTGIKKATEKGYTVVSDRYFFSSLAYQSQGDSAEVSRRVNSAFPLPALLFFFDLDVDTALSRVGSRNETREIYEKKDFLEKTKSAYEKVISEYEKAENNDGMKVVRIDAKLPKEEITKIIWHEIQNLPIDKV